MNDAERRRRLEALFREHADAVHAYARRRADATDADDVLSEVFAIACRRLEDVPDTPRPWLLACARRVLANQRRGTRRLVSLRSRIAAAVAPELPAERGDVPLRTAINKLGPRDREILLLTAWEGLTISEVAGVLGCSSGAAAVRLHRARKRLEAALARLENHDLRTEAMEVVR